MLTFAALYLYRPFTLGFYSDDWSGIVNSVNHGAPFSLERFLWRWDTFARPLQNLERYLSTSILGTSTVAWHVLMFVLVAVVCYMLRRFMLALGARPNVATIASTLWLVFPWSLGYRAWPICSTILFSTICFLAGSLALLRQRAWIATVWFAASMLLYEAFYFQFVAILVILALRPETRRWALRRALPLLLLLQAGVIVLNRLAATYAPSLGKSYASDWILRFGWSLLRSGVTLSEGIVGSRALAIAIILLCVLFVVAAAYRTASRGRLLELGAAVVGIVIAVFVLSIAGYLLAAIGHASRTFVAVDLWIATIVALSCGKQEERPWPRWAMGAAKRPWPRWALSAGIAALLVILAASTAIRTGTWQEAWTQEKVVLDTVPYEAVRATDPKAVILVSGLPYVDGEPVFNNHWGMTNAVANWPPGDGTRRRFTPALPDHSVAWDGQKLTQTGFVSLAGSELWLWRYPAQTLEPVTSPGPIF